MKKLLMLIPLLTGFNANASNVDKHLLNEMLTTVNRQYLEKVDNMKAVTAGLQALSQLDNGIKVSPGAENFYIYYNGKISKVVPLPKDRNDILGWVTTIAKVMNNAAQISEKASVRDFEMPDLFMKKLVQSLDEYSHYYSEYEYVEEDEESGLYTLYADRMIDDVLYIRIRVFNKQTGDSVKRSLQNNPDAVGVILDLRGNRGGMFNEALKTAKLFSDNEIITFTAGRDKQNTRYYTSGEGALYDGPLVVLIDAQTASAAEVLAAGLKEQSRAKILGTHSFGKGTIQNITVMSNGGKLVLTNEQFFTPSGQIIHKKGLEPDVCVTVVVDGECEKEERPHNEEDIEAAIKLIKE